MSGLLAGKVWQSNLDGTLKPLAACLADIANDDGSRIFPSLEYICWLMSKSPRAVQYQLHKLEGAGILEVVSEPTGRAGEFKEYQMIEAKLPKRKPWKLFKAGAKTARGQLGAKTAEPGAVLAEPGAKSDISPYIEPSLPVLTRQQDKPRRGSEEEEVDPSIAFRAEMVEFLESKVGPVPNHSREGKALKWLFSHEYEPGTCKRCLDYLLSQEWRTTAVTWVTVQKEIGNWQRRGEPARQLPNGNGYSGGNGAVSGRLPAVKITTPEELDRMLGAPSKR